MTIHKGNILSKEVNIPQKVETASVEENLVVNDISTGKIVFNTGIKKTGFLNRTYLSSIRNFPQYSTLDRQRRMGNLERVEVVDVPLSHALATERYVTIEVLVFKEDIGKIRCDQIPIKGKRGSVVMADVKIGNFKFLIDKFGWEIMAAIGRSEGIDEYGYAQVWALWGKEGEGTEPFPLSIAIDFPSITLIFSPPDKCNTIRYKDGGFVYDFDSWCFPYQRFSDSAYPRDACIFFKKFYVVAITYDLRENKRYVERLTDYHYEDHKAHRDLPSDYVPTPKKLYFDFPKRLKEEKRKNKKVKNEK
jgi:hypothetical protein